MLPIYLDYNATTPIAPEVLDAMGPFLLDQFGNPSSSYDLGRTAHEAIEVARGQLARLLGATSDEIVFTSCGTESNNLAIKGICLPRILSKPGHLVISAFEHPAVVEPVRFLQRAGCTVSIVPVSADGVVDPHDVAAAINSDTLLVSVMHANNEIGTIQPIAEIAEHCRARSVPLHCDAAQSVGKVAIDVKLLGVDLLTVAGHKLFAPKGVGALFVRRGIALEPLLHGAGHESGRRAGTENVPYLVGLGTAAELAAAHLTEHPSRVAALRDRLAARLQQAIPHLAIHGARSPRLPNTLSASFPGVRGVELLARCPLLSASTGSACHAGTTTMSATLAAIGLTPQRAAGTVRLSLGRYTTLDEVDQAAEWLFEAWRSLVSSAG